MATRQNRRAEAAAKSVRSRGASRVLMTRCSRLIASSLVGLLLACAGRTHIRTTPREVKDVADSVRIRATFTDGRPLLLGRSINWRRGVPAIVTAAGDTVIPAPEAKLEVVNGRRNHMVGGAVVGYLTALTVMFTQCSPNFRTCGEQDPTPVLGILLGALIGAQFKDDRWVTVRRPGLSPP